MDSERIVRTYGRTPLTPNLRLKSSLLYEGLAVTGVYRMHIAKRLTTVVPLGDHGLRVQLELVFEDHWDPVLKFKKKKKT